MSQKNITVTGIKAFSDNYIWALVNSKNRNVVLVDPGQASVCISYIQENNLILTDILITHYHADHIGGLDELIHYGNSQAAPINIYGPKNEFTHKSTIELVENDTVNLTSINTTFSVIDLPGHTSGHIAYVNAGKLFCGDTLFSGGCGRLFEGTPNQMYSSLTKLKNLPDDTLVYCTHEYTKANLSFAVELEPDNAALNNYVQEVDIMRAKGVSTIPSSIIREKMINPFLRCDSTQIISNANKYFDKPHSSEVDVFTSIRRWKDNF